MKFKYTILFFIAVMLVYLTGLPIDIMEVDAAQYAVISFEMFESKDYLQLYCRGYDYLDKPPFLFWLNQIFFFLFGVHDWSFKIGNLLFVLLGLYSTYKLGKLIYNESIGKLAALILGTTQAWFLISHDVKTDGILAAAIIYSVWQWKAFIQHNHWKNLIGLSIGISIGMLTKGPLGLLVPGMVMMVDLIASRNLKFIFNPKYLVSIIVIFVALLPMLYGLYMQFDMHPGKTVSGNHVVDSGLKFYFWTQSFGRITGESNWNNSSPFYYFLPELAWAFIPWTVFIIQSLLFNVKNNFKLNLIPLAGFILPFVALSFSRFKLSHYIFICFPFIALLIANYLYSGKHKKLSNWISLLLSLLIIPGIIFLGYCFNIHPLMGILLSIGLITIMVIVYITLETPYIHNIAILAIGINLFLHGFIYPALLKYQSFSMLAQDYIKASPNHEIPLIEIGTWSFSSTFYSRHQVKNYGDFNHFCEVEPSGYYWIYFPEKQLEGLLNPRIRMVEQKIYAHYSVTRLKAGFIWPETRNDFISKTYLVKVYLQ